MPVRGSRASVLICGFGRRGREWHAVLSRRGSPAVAATVADPDPGARDAAERVGVPAFPSVPEALAAGDANLCIVSTPATAHADCAVVSLDAGLDVLVEKPLACDSGEARDVAEAAERTGRLAIVGMNYRYRPPERALAKALESGLVGKVRSATVLSARTAAAHRTGTPASEHRALWEFCVHHLDMLRGWLGGAPDEVEAWFDAGRRRYDVRLSYPGGRRAVYVHEEGSAAANRLDWLQGESADLVNERGRVRLLRSSSRPRRVRPPHGAAPEHVLLAMLAGREPPAPDLLARSQVATVETIEAVLDALRPLRSPTS